MKYAFLVDWFRLVVTVACVVIAIVALKKKFLWKR
jgi:hypothetical protein